MSTTTKEASPHCDGNESLASELRSERELTTEFIAATSHDVRSPLGAINIFCEILLNDSDKLSESQRQNISMIAQAAQKLQRIVEDAVEVSRIHHGDARLIISNVNLGELLRHVTADIQPLAAARRIEIQNHLTNEAPSLAADSQRLGQIVLRILNESLACADDNSKIQIRGAARGEDYLLHVSSPLSSARCAAHRPEEQLEFRLRGKLGVRKEGESRYSLATAIKLASLLGGRLDVTWDSQFTGELLLPLNSSIGD